MSDVYPNDENLLQDSQEPLNLATPPQQPRKKPRGNAAIVANQAVQVKKAAEYLAEKEVENFHLREDNEELRRKDALSTIRIKELVDEVATASALKISMGMIICKSIFVPPQHCSSKKKEKKNAFCHDTSSPHRRSRSCRLR